MVTLGKLEHVSSSLGRASRKKNEQGGGFLRRSQGPLSCSVGADVSPQTPLALHCCVAVAYRTFTATLSQGDR